MPISPHYKVLVTGASGFIAAWVVHTLLDRGHHVRGTVRSIEKGKYLGNLFSQYGNRFEYVLVEDIARDGAFDDVCEGMDAIIHIASPFHFDANDPQELILPAVKGTTGILESVLKFAPTVKRIVITSSSVTCMSEFPLSCGTPRVNTFTEKDWNMVSIQIVNETGKDAPQVHKYGASKVLAERAAWEFVEKHREEITWDLVTLQPPFVFGPTIHEVSSPSALNTSNAEFLALLHNRAPIFAASVTESAGSYVDVRDVAWAHAEALFNHEIACRSGREALYEGKGRMMLSAGEFSWKDVLDTLSTSNLLPRHTALSDNGCGTNVVHPMRIDSQRARDVLGLEFRNLTETFVDTLVNFRQKGWVE